MQYRSDGVKVETDKVGGIRRAGRTIYDRRLVGTEAVNDLVERGITVSRDMGRRLIGLYSLLYSAEVPYPLEYDCFRGAAYLLGRSGPNRLLDYISDMPHDPSKKVHPNRLEPEKAYVVRGNRGYVLRDVGPTHAVVSVDETHVVHVTGPNSDFAYSPAADVLVVWPGSLHEVQDVIGS